MARNASFFRKHKILTTLVSILLVIIAAIYIAIQIHNYRDNKDYQKFMTMRWAVQRVREKFDQSPKQASYGVGEECSIPSEKGYPPSSIYCKVETRLSLESIGNSQELSRVIKDYENKIISAAPQELSLADDQKNPDFEAVRNSKNSYGSRAVIVKTKDAKLKDNECRITYNLGSYYDLKANLAIDFVCEGYARQIYFDLDK